MTTQVRRYTLKTPAKPAKTYKVRYEEELNSEQLDVVQAGEGPLLVIAGAGSGKTRALTYRVSRLIENLAVGGPAGAPPFLNGAAELSTTLDPQPLLATLLDIERALGRERRQKWAPRTIDLDLLLYDDLVIRSDDLTIPHPLMHERDFVLTPLTEIAPDVVHPILRKTVRALCDSRTQSSS